MNNERGKEEGHHYFKYWANHGNVNAMLNYARILDGLNQNPRWSSL